jgi:2-polyprenyl-6-methoxyphenol hydroxylase-like FAD-dependent oxidoreductase
MSPIGGFGVNLAIQDAVAAANILSVPLREGRLADRHLAAVEKRRAFPTKATQKLQLMMQSSSKKRQESATKRSGPPSFVKGIARWPFLAHLTGRLVGLGIRSEKVNMAALKVR